MSWKGKSPPKNNFSDEIFATDSDVHIVLMMSLFTHIEYQNVSFLPFFPVTR